MPYNFNPTDGLNNKTTFPTTPVSEDAARQQFMTLFNQLLGFINTSDGKFTNYPLKTDFEKSLSSKGYQKIPSAGTTKYTEQWGYELINPTPNENMSKQIEFSQPFPNACVSVQVTPNTSYPDKVKCSAGSLTKDGVTLYLNRTNDTQTGLWWRAIGY